MQTNALFVFYLACSFPAFGKILSEQSVGAALEWMGLTLNSDEIEILNNLLKQKFSVSGLELVQGVSSLANPSRRPSLSGSTPQGNIYPGEIRDKVPPPPPPPWNK